MGHSFHGDLCNVKFQNQEFTFPYEPSPRKAELSKLFVASFNSSKLNDRQLGRICTSDFEDSKTCPEEQSKGKMIYHHPTYLHQIL